MAALVRSFNESQTSYEVVMRPAGDPSSSPDLPIFLNALEAGNPPDIIGLEGRHIADLAAAKALTPLDEDEPDIGYAQTDYLPPFSQLGVYRGQRYGLPISADVVTLYINLSSTRGTRFHGGTVPGNLEEFDRGLRELQSAGKTGLIPTYPGWWPHAWVWFFNGTWFDKQGHFIPDHPANVRAYAWVASLKQLWNLKDFQEPINPIGSRDPDPFLSGEVAMVFEGDWIVRRLMQRPTLNWLPQPFPTMDGRPAALIEADLLSIPAGADQVEGAKWFIGYATRPASIMEIALGHQKILPLQHWPQRFMAKHPNPNISAFRDILMQAELFHDPQVPGWMHTLARIKKAFKEIWSGEETAQQALRAIRDDPGKPRVEKG